MRLKFSRHDFEKYSNPKFNENENPSRGSRFILCGGTERRTVIKLIVAFRNFANAPNNNNNNNNNNACTVAQSKVFPYSYQSQYNTTVCCVYNAFFWPEFSNPRPAATSVVYVRMLGLLRVRKVAVHLDHGT
jgi:hypothetical protein